MTSYYSDPLRDLVALQDRMSRLFEDTLRSRGSGQEQASGTWSPSADIYEKDDSLILALELPGVPREEVEIRLDNNLLTVQGERKLPTDVDRRSFHRMEGDYGRFSRNFTLPAGIDPEAISASSRDGVLMIRIPRAVQAKSRQINIK